MKIEKWQKILLSILLIYIASTIIVLSSKDICLSMFFSSFCGSGNRFLWVICPAVLLTVLVLLWGKEVMAHPKQLKISAGIGVFVLILFIIGYYLQPALFPDRCNEQTAKIFIFDELEKLYGTDWESRLNMNKREFFQGTFGDIYDTGRKTYGGYRICHIKNKIFRFGDGAQEIYYYYDYKNKKYIKY